MRRMRVTAMNLLQPLRKWRRSFMANRWMSTEGETIAVCELWRRQRLKAFMWIRTRASLRRVIRKQHRCACTGDCNEAVQTEGGLCVKCTTCTSGDCCKQDDTDESDDDSREDDTKHDRRRGETCGGKTAPCREKMDTQRISPAVRWSEMDAGAWLRALGATTSHNMAL